MSEWKFTLFACAGLLVLVTLEAGLFVVLGLTGIAPNLASGIMPLSIIAGITGVAAIVAFLIGRRK